MASVGDGSGGKLFKSHQSVRYSEMDAETKAKVRAEERAGKKERDRLIRYFTHSRGSLEAAATAGPGGAPDVQMIASMLDGLHTEVAKIVKKETDREILRVGSVCRALETAISMSSLSQLESLAYVLLGTYTELLSWPTASYLVETLWAAVYHTLSQTAEFSPGSTTNLMGGGENAEQERKQIIKHGVDTLPGREDGMPNISELSGLFADEIGESALTLMMDASGSRAVRSILKLFSGIPIRGVGKSTSSSSSVATAGTVGESGATAEESQPILIHFPSALKTLVTAITGCIEDNGGWVSCSTTQGACTVAQGLVECASVNEDLATTVRAKVQAAIPHLLNDSYGVYVVQAYLSVRCRWKLWNHNGNAGKTTSGGENGGQPAEEVKQEGETRKEPAAALLLPEDAIWWNAAWRILSTRLVDVINSCGSPNCLNAEAISNLLGNLACFAPTAESFRDFVETIVVPCMKKFIADPQLFPVLLRSLQKCTAISRAAELAEKVRSGKDISRETKNMITVFFSIPVETKRTLVGAINQAIKENHTNRGAAQYFLVDCQQSVHDQLPDTSNPPEDTEYARRSYNNNRSSNNHQHHSSSADQQQNQQQDVGEEGKVVHNVGPEVLAELLRLKEVVPCLAAQSFGRLGLNELIAAMMDPQGTRAVQQYITFLSQVEAKLIIKPQPKKVATTAAVAKQPGSKQQQGGANQRGKRGRGDFQKDQTPNANAAGEDTSEPPTSTITAKDVEGGLSRFHRRIENNIVELCCGKFSSFCIQHLYESSPFILKECLNRLLKQHYQDIKKDFYGAKVLEQCHLESYMWRYDEWKKVQERHSQVKRMMAQILGDQN